MLFNQTRQSALWLSVIGLFMAFYSSHVSALTIFACEAEYASLAAEIAPNADIFSATSTKQDPHHVQARPSLIAQLRQADLAICAGAELEIGWFPLLQRKANNPLVLDGASGMLYAADVVEAIDKYDRLDRSMGDLHRAGNPHFQFSPQRVGIIAQAIRDKLMLIDPTQAEYYQSQWQQFDQRWRQATERWQQQATPLVGMKVVAYHSNFAYLFEWLGIDKVADLEPKPGLPPSSGHLSRLVAQLQGQPVEAIIYTDYQDARGAQWLAKHTKVPLLLLPLAPQVAADDDLFRLYQRVLEQLLAVL
ncbi:MAG: zinc ABC transporter substrate-binding protein [Ferrimonas sp.]